jgi:hypothetical protein
LMNFKVTSQGNKITLSGLNLQMTNWTWTMTVSVYKNSVSPTNLLWTAVGTNASNVSTFNVWLSTTVEVEGSMDFVVEVAWYIPVLNGQNNLTRSFKITDLNYLDMFQDGNTLLWSISSYTNMNLPLSAPNYTP